MMRQFEKSSWRRRAGCNGLMATLLVFACLQACMAGHPALNSERIARRFGSYGVELLPSEPGIRRASLYSVHDDRHICRTYAVVRWLHTPDETDEDLADAHARILSGASLGATLQSAGWELDKRTRYVGTLPDLTPQPDWLALMDLDSSVGLALHVYKLNIKKGSKLIEYAEIIEVHHPAHLDETQLRRTTGPSGDPGLDAASLAAVYSLLVGGH